MLQNPLTHAIQCLTIGAGLMVSISAHSIVLDTKEALYFGLGGEISPSFTTTTNDSFHYTYGDPKIYGTNGTIADVLQDQDRQDAKRNIYLQGVNDASIFFYAQQHLTKDYMIGATTGVLFNNQGYHPYGANWGVELERRNIANLKIGSRWAGFDITQTSAENLLSAPGTNIHLNWTKIPNLSISGFYMLAPSSDVRNPYNADLHKAHGLSASYLHSFAPRQNLEGKIGFMRTDAHDKPLEATAQKGKANAVMASISYQHNNATFATDYGMAQKRHNGAMFDRLKTQVFGARFGYEITPRLEIELDYARNNTQNNQPIRFADLVNHGSDVHETDYFHQVIKDDYGASLSYQLYKGISLKGSAKNSRTRNFLSDGEFSRRSSTTYSVGARFSFW